MRIRRRRHTTTSHSTNQQYRTGNTIFRWLTAIITLLFLAFFVVGLNLQGIVGTQFNVPIMTDTIIILSIILVVGAIVATIWSVIATTRKNKSLWHSAENGIPKGKIQITTFLTLAIIMIITFIFGSKQPLTINQLSYDNASWLKTADMLITTSAILLIVAILCIIAAKIIDRNR